MCIVATFIAAFHQEGTGATEDFVGAVIVGADSNGVHSGLGILGDNNVKLAR